MEESVCNICHQPHGDALIVYDDTKSFHRTCWDSMIVYAEERGWLFINKLRPCIKNLAIAMESTMTANDEEKGDSWKETPMYDLHEMLMGEIAEARDAFQDLDPEQYHRELIDIANFCAMITERIRMRNDSKAAKVPPYPNREG